MADKKLSAIVSELSDYNDATARVYGIDSVPTSVYLLPSKLVNTVLAQTIAGVKTFSSFPITPSSAPTTDYQVANKKYVDDSLVSLSSYRIESNSTNSYAEFGTAGANEYLDVATYDGVSASKRVAQFGDGSTHSRLIVDPDGIKDVSAALYFGGGGYVYGGTNSLIFGSGSTDQFTIFGSGLRGVNTSSAALLNEAATANNPSIAFKALDTDTGGGNAGNDMGTLVAGQVEVLRFSEGNSRTSVVLNGTVVENIINGDTTISTPTLTKTGENFLTTVNVGDVVVLYGGTTPADFGTYIVRSVDSDTQLTVDRNFTASNSDVDFDIISKGTLIENSTQDGVSNIHTNAIYIDEALNYGSNVGVIFGDRDSYIRETSDDIIRIQSTSVGFGITPSGNSQVAMNALPTSSAGLSTGDLFTQTATELGGSGATKVLCIV